MEGEGVMHKMGSKSHHGGTMEKQIPLTIEELRYYRMISRMSVTAINNISAQNMNKLVLIVQKLKKAGFTHKETVELSELLK